MNEALVFLFSAFGMGVLTAVHPCPLTIHFAMLGLLTSWSSSSVRRGALIILFISAYIVILMALAAVLGSGVLAIDDLARFIQQFTRRLLGPLLMLVAVFQLDLVPWRRDGFALRWERLRNMKPGPLSAIFSGMLFALAFCPATAMVYFALFIPLAISADMILSGALAYGLGVLTPLLLVLLLAYAGVHRLDGREQGYRRWSRRLSRAGGVVLLLTGFYLSLRDIYGY